MLVSLLLSTLAWSEPDIPGEVRLDLTAFDVPFNLEHGYSAPSMDQSVEASFALYRLAAFGLHEASSAVFPQRKGWRYGLGVPTTALITSVALAPITVWLHEEWHRAVLSRRQISSKNGVYKTPFGALVAVYDVKDADLSRLKRDHPAEFVRLTSAGLESVQGLVHRTGEELFFHGASGRDLGPFYSADSWMAPTLVFGELNNLLYLQTCASPSSDAITQSIEVSEITMGERDFAGLDCVAWTYDLFRPDEPYEARGPHPSGLGIARYRTWSHLSEAEQSFLKLQSRLYFLNILNPHLFGLNGWRLGEHNSRMMVTVDHQLTSFGYSINTHFYWKTDASTGSVSLRNGFNTVSWFPGIDASLQDIRLPLSMRTDLDVEASVWLQPSAQRVSTRTMQPGGRIEASLVTYPHDRIGVRAAVEAKTAGFVPGNVYLTPNVSARLGLTALLW